MKAIPSTVPELISVKSSNVDSVGYDYDTRYLYVLFLSGDPRVRGTLYRYTDVPSRVYDRFLKSSSKGLYVWTYIRDKFHYAKWTGFGWRKESALKTLSAQKQRRKKLFKSR